MTERPDAGIRWMRRHTDAWSVGTVVATHAWWHIALFHLAHGKAATALRLYDQQVRAERSTEISDLIDASSLLWRIGLAGYEVGARWAELAGAWSARTDDRFCSFNDVHAMLAFVGARDWGSAGRLEASLAAAQSGATRHGMTTRLLGLPACRALVAFGRGDDERATTLLASLPAFAHRMGGSLAQRDVLHLTLVRSIERLRRPRPRWPVAVSSGLTYA